MNQRRAAEQGELSELTQRAAGMLKSALTAGDSNGIADAVSLFDEVMSICSRGPHVEYWKSVVNLADALIKQAEADGLDGPIDSALDLLDANEQHFRTIDQQVPFLQRKGQALLLKAQRTADRAVMRAAVQARKKRARLTPRSHAGYGEGMLELGMTLLHSGAMFRNVADLHEAVAVLEAAEKHPDGSADRSLVLTSLGNARLERLLRSAGRSRAELDVVVADHMEAMHERSPGGENSLVIESDYGSALFRAYELTRNREYLDAALGAVRRAAEQTPAGHSRKSERLNNLVSVLLALSECDGDPATLDEAILMGREAVAAANPRHAQYATSLFGLAYGLFRRGELRGTLLDFDEAAVLAAQAVEATPPGHTYRAMHLTLHAQALCYLPSTLKLEKAATRLAGAASLLRHDDPDRAVIESNHGAILEVLASLPGSGEDPVALAVEAVRLTRKAADATPPEHSEYSNRLLNLTIASATLARLSGDAAVLDDPVTRCEATRTPEPSDVSSTLLTAGLAHALAVRYDLTEVPEAASAAIEAYQLAAGDARLAVFRRLHIAQSGAVLAARCGETTVSLSLYALAVELLDSAAWRGMERRDQERMLAGYAGIPSDAAAVAVTAGQPERAVEFLERGRGVLLDRHVDDSAELALLRQAAPHLAREFEDLRHALDSIVMPDLGADDFELPYRPAHQESEADQRSALALRLESLISEIRQRPECAGLFTPPNFARLQEAVGQRSTVIINISEYRCDAITVTSAGAAAVPLPSLSRTDADDAAEFFRDTAQNAVRPGWVGSTARHGIASRLAWLWDAVCEPVLGHLGITAEAPAGSRAPRVHWCPAGPAAFLPLHAAGRHGQPGPQAVIDRAESVYIARLRALAPATPDPAAAEVTTPPLIVSMPETSGQRPLPGASDEAEQLMRAFPGATHLTGPGATVEAVLTGMTAHSWFHFSAHGTTDEHTPVNGGIELADGRLTIRSLLERRLPGARFAFLSACSTHHGSAAIPDETVTTAAALCIAGCGYVVATLWPVADDHAVDFAARIYGELITAENGTPALHPEDIPRVIREVCRAVRNTYPQHPERWVPFASAGSL